MSSYGVPNSGDDLVVADVSKAPRLSVGPNLHLPNRGNVWALDHYGVLAELVHVKYSQVDLNNHSGGIFLKSAAAPFIYKPKKTVELNGMAAAVRLHDVAPTFYIRGLIDDDSESESNSSAVATKTTLYLVRLEVKADRRVAATIAFTQLTGKASRSQDVIEIVTSKVSGSDWYRVVPKLPLAPGEYGLMRMPKGQNLFGVNIYDFAVDPNALENGGAMKSDADTVP